MKRALARCEGPSCVKGLACGAGRPLPQSARRRPRSAGAREDSHIGAISPDPCAGHAEESSVGRDRALCTIPRRFSLTRREAELLPFIARGRSARVIADALFVSENTIRTHTRRILEKTDLHSKQQVIDLIEKYR